MEGRSKDRKTNGGNENKEQMWVTKPHVLFPKCLHKCEIISKSCRKKNTEIHTKLCHLQLLTFKILTFKMLF